MTSKEQDELMFKRRMLIANLIGKLQAKVYFVRLDGKVDPRYSDLLDTADKLYEVQMATLEQIKIMPE